MRQSKTRHTKFRNRSYRRDASKVQMPAVVAKVLNGLQDFVTFHVKPTATAADINYPNMKDPREGQRYVQRFGNRMPKDLKLTPYDVHRIESARMKRHNKGIRLMRIHGNALPASDI